MKTPRRKKRPPPKRPQFFIVRRGYVQNYVHVADGQRRVVVPLFSDRATCVDFIREYFANAVHLDSVASPEYRIAEIGTVEGETLETLLATSAADEAWWIHDVRAESFSYRAMPLREVGE